MNIGYTEQIRDRIINAPERRSVYAVNWAVTIFCRYDD